LIKYFNKEYGKVMMMIIVITFLFFKLKTKIALTIHDDPLVQLDHAFKPIIPFLKDNSFIAYKGIELEGNYHYYFLTAYTLAPKVIVYEFNKKEHLKGDSVIIVENNLDRFEKEMKSLQLITSLQVKGLYLGLGTIK
jgi:hypothetical protein